MYPHFIEVHDGEDEQCEISVNIDNIVNFHVDEDGVSIIEVVSREYYRIAESYDELKELIRSAGCHIEKGDPRLDYSKQLTMQDLKDMVGQPVWDSNTGVWLLVYDGGWMYSGDPDRVCARVVNRYGCKDIWLSEDDLIKKPLYRMKVSNE